MTRPVHCRPIAYEAFRRQLLELDSTAGLFRAAFAISLHERPEADLGETESIVENLSDTVRRRVRSRSQQAILAHLHDVLFDVFGLQGNTEDYYNPANSYLADVLQTRLGIPITLVLIYKRVAEPLGIVVHGINAPGHFLARVEPLADESDQPMFVDPFFSGELLNRDEVTRRIEQATGRPLGPPRVQLAQATNRQWLARMLNNLLAAFAAKGHDREVCAMQELQELL
ncbi:MAG: transglutaminase family protein [Planctomycetales bacterium]|nr:transglutaminase family protein [Planctomycetales bacterium]